MNARTKNSVHTLVVIITVALVMVVARQGFAWTNPSGAPPFANSTIVTSGGNVGIGTATPVSKLSVLGGDVQVESGMGRFKGWYNAGSGLGAEIGISGGQAYIYSYNRTANSYQPINIGGSTIALGHSGGADIFISSSGSVGFGLTSPDANYKVTTSGGGIKAENSSATQPAGYFNNTGGGTAITIGTGGITLGGVNQTSWPSGSDSTKVLKTGDTMTGALSIVSSGGEYVGDGTSKMWLGGSGGVNYIESGNNAWNTSPVLYFTGYNGSAGNFDFNGNVGIGIGSGVPGYKLDVAGTIRTQGDFLANANYGLGLVGLYDPTKYRNVYSMGTSYRLPADGTGPGNLYGIAMTYEPNYGGAGNNAQAVAGLGHQFLFMSNGVTQTAIGTGIYTVGNAGIAGTATVNSLIAGGGSSSNWAGVNTSSINALNSIYSYGSICTGNASGACSAANGTVLGINNTSAANNIPNSGAVFFNSGNVGIGTTAPGDKLEINGNLRFTGSNPYITSSSYAIIPGGAYFNSGTVYTEAAIQARGGLHNDSGSYLALQGGTTGKTQLSGAMVFPDGTEQSTAAKPFRGVLAFTSIPWPQLEAGTRTTIPYGFERFDTDNIHDTVTNPQRLTVPAGVKKVRLTVHLGVGSVPTTAGYLFVQVKKNGSTNNYDSVEESYPLDTIHRPSMIMTSPPTEVIAGDYFTVDVTNSVGILTGVMSWFSMEVIE